MFGGFMRKDETRNGVCGVKPESMDYARFPQNPHDCVGFRIAANFVPTPPLKGAEMSESPTPDEQFEQETLEHIRTVSSWLGIAQQDLDNRRIAHDASKLQEPERSGFQAMTADARLKDLTYGSEEYRAVLREHEATIKHHYLKNDHHPEHWAVADPGDRIADPLFYDKELAKNGYAIRRMSLLSLLEMLCDWKASTSRMKDGDLMRSIEINADRFGYGPEIKWLLINTARELGMIRN